MAMFMTFMRVLTHLNIGATLALALWLATFIAGGRP